MGKIDFERIYDVNYRLNNLYKIVDKNRKSITLKQNRIQRTLTKNSHIKKKKILKARQEGVSTNEIISQLDYTIFHKNVTACILADCDDNIKKLFRIVQRAYRGLHPAFKPRLGRGGGSMYEYYFPDLNSRIFVALKSRSETINWLHISETAFIKDTDRIDATTETVPLDGIITHETTANGMNNHFYDFWNADNDYHPFFFPWYFHDEYRLPVEEAFDLTDEELSLCAYVKREHGFELDYSQIAFRRWKMRNNRLFKQEYAEDPDSCFITSGKSIFDAELLRNLMSKCREPIESEGEWFKQWEDYNKELHYVIGADTAEGVGGDYSVAIVYEARTFRQVAMIRSNKWKPREFAEKLYWLGNKYTTGGRRWPLMGVELNNHGHSVIQKLEDLVYPNLYEYAKDKPGWLTNSITRPIMIDGLIDAVEEGMAVHYDRELFNELLALVDIDGKVQAAPGKHDDYCIAAAIGLQMCVEMADVSHYADLKSKIYV